MGSSYVVGYLIGAFIWGIIWGFTAKAVVTNKGYEDEGTKYFWLGFFFSFIAVIVAAAKPVYQKQDNHQLRSTTFSNTEEERQQEILDDGGWKCVCGRVNYYYSSRCYCGKSRSEGDVKKQVTKESKNAEAKKGAAKSKEYSEAERIRLIKDYKKLLDTGILTQEEFDKKKEQLLWEKTILLDDTLDISDSGKCEKDEKEVVIPEGPVIPLIGEKEDSEICPICGDVQRAGRTKCWKCGVQFTRVKE